MLISLCLEESFDNLLNKDRNLTMIKYLMSLLILSFQRCHDELVEKMTFCRNTPRINGVRKLKVLYVP
jgi:hypothetical protein